MKNQNPALVLIDLQKGFHEPFWGKGNNPSLEANVEKILDHWRKKKWPIFHVQHLSKNRSSPLHPSHKGVGFMDCVEPLPGEPIFQKNVNSCFIGTSLEAVLREKGIQSLVFIGIASDHCVSTSTRMASNLGFECRVVSDGTRAYERKDPDGLVYEADLVHAISLASLHGEFAEVMSTENLLQSMD